jgi:hypothetical protein
VIHGLRDAIVAYVVWIQVRLVGRFAGGADGVMMSLRVHEGTLTLDAVAVKAIAISNCLRFTLARV